MRPYRQAVGPAGGVRESLLIRFHRPKQVTPRARKAPFDPVGFGLAFLVAMGLKPMFSPMLSLGNTKHVLEVSP